ncbi:MAG: threonine/serine dehydratase [Gemmatimonadota bacterium]
MEATRVELDTLLEARDRLRGQVHLTPLLPATLLGRQAEVRLWLKCENLQKTGSFKVRGVLNKLLGLGPEERARGVVTVSAGNHAQALAWGARAAGVPCTVVMPADASPTKAAASRAYGAEVVLHGDVFAAFARARALAEERGLTFVHPFDDPAIVAGHASAGLEILEQLRPPPDAVVVPVGGGGLIAGIASAVKLRRPDLRVYGVEPEGAAAMYRSLEERRPVRLDEISTIADGLAPPMAGELPYDIVRRLVEEIVLVTDAEIARAMREILAWAKLLAEPAGAAGVAALLAGRLSLENGTRVVCVLSGGNVDPGELGAIPGFC